jgi:hypothetical protein
VDNDGDGYTENQGDCNDANAFIHPGANEICGDGVDQDCNGSDLPCPPSPPDVDNDGDGYTENQGDCNDAESTIHPGATEVCNGIDDNCNGSVDEGCLSFYQDSDGDGYGNANVRREAVSQPRGYVTDSTDCNDGNAGIHPGAAEVCNGIDDNCNGSVDEGCLSFYQDSDGDGYGNANVSLEAFSQPRGYVTDRTDCKDGNAGIHPGAAEVCNGIDDNCNGSVDEGCQSFYKDSDGDGYGNGKVKIEAFLQPRGYVADGTDCNDGDATIHPGAAEVCNGIDDNCNGSVDEGCRRFFRDSDGDGYGNAKISQIAVFQPRGYVTNSTDCNDGDAAINPGEIETCNQIDDNCDGRVDEGCQIYYLDRDRDGYGNSNIARVATSQPFGYVPKGADCNDADASINPGAPEICRDKIDNNCNGKIDETPCK